MSFPSSLHFFVTILLSAQWVRLFEFDLRTSVRFFSWKMTSHIDQSPRSYRHSENVKKVQNKIKSQTKLKCGHLSLNLPFDCLLERVSQLKFSFKLWIFAHPPTLNTPIFYLNKFQFLHLKPITTFYCKETDLHRNTDV